jgi:2-oxoglutarate ferredoxin oxidoreductase subunit beta
LVEVLAACPTNWRLDPASCMEKIKSVIIPHFPLKTFSSPKKED